MTRAQQLLRLATVSEQSGPKRGGYCVHFREDIGRKVGGCCILFWGGAGSHLTQCGLGRGLPPYQVVS